MAASKSNIDRKYDAIKKRFAVLSGKKTRGGKKMFTYAAIIEQVADEFFLADTTVEKIICK